MEGANRVFGIGGTVFFDGRECRVGPRTGEFYGLIDAEILKSRGDPFEQTLAAAKSLKSDDGKADVDAIRAVAETLYAAARSSRNVTRFEQLAFIDTWDGMALEFWHCLKDNFPQGWSVARVRWVLQESNRLAFDHSQEAGTAWHLWVSGIRKAIEVAGGEDLLGNLTGFRVPTANPLQPSDPSSETSAKSTDVSPETSEN